jgi:hypothetical protein
MRFGVLMLVALGFEWAIRARWRSFGVRSLARLGAIVVTACLVALAAPPSQRLNDFDKAYYHAATVIWTGAGDLYGSEGVQGFVNIPIVALLVAPLAAVPQPAARLLYTTAGLWIAVAAYRVLSAYCAAAGKPALLIGLLFVVNGPLMYSVQIGNNTHHVLLILAAALWALDRGKEALGGILVAVAGILKLPLLLLGAYFVVRRRPRAIAAFGATIGGCVLLSIALFGMEAHRQWFDEVVKPFAGRPMAAYNVQSIDGLLARQLTDADIGEWMTVEAGPSFHALRLAALLALVLGVAWAFLGTRAAGGHTTDLEFSILLAAAIVASPISWTHYYLLLLVPFSLYAGRCLPVPRKGGWLALMIASIALASLPVRQLFILGSLAHGALPRLLISHYLAGGVILLAVLIAARRQPPPASAG